MSPRGKKGRSIVSSMGLVQPRHGLWSPLVSTPSSFISSAAANEAHLPLLEACQQAPSQALPGVRPVKAVSPQTGLSSTSSLQYCTHNIVESYCDILCFQLSQSLDHQRLSILAPLIRFAFDPASQSRASPDASSVTRRRTCFSSSSLDIEAAPP